MSYTEIVALEVGEQLAEGALGNGTDIVIVGGPREVTVLRRLSNGTLSYVSSVRRSPTAKAVSNALGDFLLIYTDTERFLVLREDE